MRTEDRKFDAHAPGLPVLIGGDFNTNTQAAMFLGAKGYHYRFASGTDMHFPPKAGANDFPSALRWLWRGYKTPP